MDVEGPGHGQAEQIADALGYQAFTCALAGGRRIRPQHGATGAWMPRPAVANGNRSLYFDSERPLSPGTLRLPRYRSGDPGTLGIAVLVRSTLAMEGSRILHLPALGRDRVRRAAVVADITVDGTPLSVVGTHMSHLHMGSHRHWLALRRLLATDARPDAVLSGDMNLWGPPVRAFLPEWHRAVKGRTWPAWHPHSQIDHILVRGALRVCSGEVLPAVGSDHRPVRAELALR